MRRVLLLNREQSEDDPDSFVLNFRHYAITTKATGMSKALKRLNVAEKLMHSKKARKGGLPNLGKLQDIADYMVGGEDGEGYVTDGATSGSEAETDAEVEVLDTAAARVQSRKTRAAAAASEDPDNEEEEEAPVEEADSGVVKRAVKLVELGPRMKLRLVKVEEGLCQGQVMWHEHIHKSKQEIRELKERWEQRRRDKEARTKQQKENVERKKKAKADSGKARKTDDGADDEDEDEMDVDVDDFDSDDYEAYSREGLADDAEAQLNAQMDDAGEWEDEEE